MDFRNTVKCLVFMLLFAANSTYAQTADSVVLRPNYTQQAFYNITTGATTYATLNDWDLAFGVNGTFDAAIWVNEAIGLSAYLTSDTNWATSLDTADLSTWTPLDNSRDSWTDGALNASRNTSDVFDYGWGNYDQGSNQVLGSNIFVIAFPDTTFKKLRISALTSLGNVYQFQYGDLDGSNTVTDSLDKTDYPDRLFGYYDLETSTASDREPAKGDWDLLFTTDLVPTVIPNFGTSFNQGTVYSNPNTLVQAYENVVTTTENLSFTDFDTSSIAVIGSAYRYNAMGPWIIVDSLVYFSQAQSGLFYKIVFTEFQGLSSGVIKFNKTQLIEEGPTGINEISSTADFNLYPNPAQNTATLSWTSIETAELDVYILDLSGRALFNNKITTAIGSGTLTIPTADLQSGAYIILVDDGSSVNTQKLMKY